MSELLIDKYKIKDEIEHILDRSGMWLGSTEYEQIEYPLYIPSKDKINNIAISYNAGLIKLIDEVISNSIDEYRRSKTSKKDCLFEIKKITVEVNENGSVIIEDDGGIPVLMHNSGFMVPELIFGQLRTSSNYEDKDDREVVGTNGLGAKLTNIFSSYFSVDTADGKKRFYCQWSNNMRNKEESEIVDCKEHYTKIMFNLDLHRFTDQTLGFNSEEKPKLLLGTVRAIQKRCIDAAAANPGLVIEFKSDIKDGVLNSMWKFDNFDDYVRLYCDDNTFSMMTSYQSKRDIIKIFPSSNTFRTNVGFVNGALCSEGTHIKKIEKQITDKILDLCKEDDMELITEKDVLSHMVIFVNCTIFNPKYDSQSKDKLTNKIDKSNLLFDDNFLNGLSKSPIYENIKIFFNAKYAAEKKKELKKLNGLIKNTKTKKLIKSATNSVNDELWLFEGNSAGMGFRKGRDLHQSAYLLRGKIRNTFNLSKSQILDNVELREVLAVCDLQFNEPAKNLKNFKFSKLVLAMDMDVDGHHISGLFLAFFTKHFPEIIRAGKIFRAVSPIIIATKGKDIQRFYSLKDYHEVENNLKNHDIIYTKGLGGLTNEDYKDMLRNPRLIKFQYIDEMDYESVIVWFDKSTEIRKQILAEDLGGDDEE